jgi:acetyl-CoA C-acetyltransferase
MSSNGIRDRAAVVGMGCTRFTDHWDRGLDDLLVEAVHEAVDSAGLKLSDVDAFWFGTATSGSSGLTLSRALKVEGKPVTRVENYCATGSEALRNAAYGVASGAYDTVVAVGGEKLKDTRFAGLATGASVPTDGTTDESSAPARFALLAPAYSARYGVDREALREVMSRIAWKNHRNAVGNPRAQFQREVTMESITNSPKVAGDLGVFDCSGMSDGAAAAVLVRGEDALRYRPDPLYIKGLSLVAGSGRGLLDETYDYTSFPEVAASAADAYQQAGITDPRAQLAVAEVHDCFTPTELLLMEDLGFSERGEGWRDVLDGVFDRDGELAVNADGGLKSFGHPIGASGLRMLYECWLQLRGEAGDRQIQGAGQAGKSYGLTHNLGGPPGDCVSFVSVVGTELG